MDPASHSTLAHGQATAWEHPGKEFLRSEMQLLVNKVQSLSIQDRQDDEVTTILYRKARELEFRYTGLPDLSVEHPFISSFISEMQTLYTQYKDFNELDFKFENLDISDLPHQPKPQLIASDVIPYSYTPLQPYKEFRLVHLRSSQYGSPRHCDIEHVSFGQLLPYEALSYTWGDPKDGSLVPCKGDPFEMFDLMVGSDQRNLKIGYNLMCALKEIRHQTESKTLWVDAICINQKDDDEKSWQVTRMAQIYKNASNVIAWLGEHDEYTDLAFDIFEDICWATKAGIWRYYSAGLRVPLDSLTSRQVQPVMEYAQRLGIFPRRYWPDAKNYIQALELTPPHQFDGGSLPQPVTAKFCSCLTFNFDVADWDDSTVNFDAIITAVGDIFFRRAYWSRMWIAQEFIHAQSITILCGTRQMNMELVPLIDLALNRDWAARLRFIPGLFDEYRIPLKNSIARIAGPWELKYTLPSSLLRMMDIFNFRRCSEPRDKIFALLNISEDIPIRVDYKADVGAVFLHATRAIIQHEKSLDVIFRKPDLWNPHSSTVDKGVRMPTWVPKFNCALQLGVMNITTEQYHAGGSKPPSFSLSKEDKPTELKIKGGFTEETVPKIFDFTQLEWLKVDPLWETVMGIRDELGLKGDDSQPSGKTLTSVSNREDATPLAQKSSIFWETLLVGLYEEYEKTKDSVVEEIVAEEPVVKELYAELSKAVASSAPKQVLSILWLTLNGKKLAVLCNGDLALVNGDPELGDLVFVAEGASVPLIIRPVDRSFNVKNIRNEKVISTDFELVGGAYIHGIMQGELFEGDNLKKVLWWHDIRLI